MLKFVAFLLIAWLVVSVLGLLIEGLLWLTFIGLVLFLATAGYLWFKRKTGSNAA
ncbi:LPXTG cell wall anchor domain-containing protein [Ruania halotolerans]|uniref:LPXTG cell wall anchor domain-containing protein n=1 Tax=Ruania halotolerans TaxID=2897773 RepID=UPI001E544910|nr:LPXTG cell wall anchor domain-containing protein [Ruania halotolerans]UFU07319.1 LPXTG cell wall anchor domain-containing protein [Ruania halotolerans]